MFVRTEMLNKTTVGSKQSIGHSSECMLQTSYYMLSIQCSLPDVCLLHLVEVLLHTCRLLSSTLRHSSDIVIVLLSNTSMCTSLVRLQWLLTSVLWSSAFGVLICL